MKWINKDIRGKYLVDNSGILRERMPRGENIRFIANYVFANPCVGANECRRALLQWRGFRQCDDSRGQYASYFYDHYHYKWYHSKVWNFMKDERGKRRMVINPGGLALIDDELQQRLKKWDMNPRQIINLEGASYDKLFSKKSKD